MNKIILTILATSLVGCATVVPITAPFPAVPLVLLEAAPNLKTISSGASSTDGSPSDVKPSKLLTTVVDNYGTYYEMREKLIGWQTWYVEQKKIFETVK